MDNLPVIITAVGTILSLGLNFYQLRLNHQERSSHQRDRIHNKQVEIAEELMPIIFELHIEVSKALNQSGWPLPKEKSEALRKKTEEGLLNLRRWILIADVAFPEAVVDQMDFFNVAILCAIEGREASSRAESCKDWRDATQATQHLHNMYFLVLNKIRQAIGVEPLSRKLRETYWL